jgi:chromate transport protein ChrA
MVLAMVVTLAVLLFRSLQGSRAATAACAIMCAVTLFAYGESLFSLVLPCQFLFLFAGGAIRKEVSTPANIETRKVAWNPR